MKIFVLLLFALYSLNLGAQSTNKVIVNLKDKSAFKEIPVKEGIVKIGKLNGEMLLTFPDEDNYSDYSIQFNEDKDKNKFTLAFNCDEKTCIQIRPSDVVNNQLKLNFSDNKLTAIGSRTIKVLSLSSTDSPYVKILSKEKKPADMYAVLEKSKDKDKVLEVDGSLLDKTNFYCGTLVCKTCDLNDTVKSHFTQKSIRDYYQQVFKTPNTFYDKITGNNVSAKYWVINDYTDGKKSITTYLKNKNTGFLKSRKDTIALWVIQKRLKPVVGKQIVYTIVGPADSAYVIDTSNVQNFLEQESQITSVIGSIKAGEPTTTDTNTLGGDTNDDGKSKSKPEPLPRPIIPDNSVVEGLKKVIDQPVKDQLAFLRSKNILNFTNADMEKVTKDKSMSHVLDSLTNEYLKSIIKIDSLQKENNRLLKDIDKKIKKINVLQDSIRRLNKQVNELNNLKDSLKVKQVEIEKLLAMVAAIPATSNLKEKLLALERDLEKFNSEYDDISFIKEYYKTDLLCMQLKIKEILHIPVSNSSKDLAQSLINLTVASVKDSSYHKDFENLIKAIEVAYGQAVSKKPVTSLFSVSRKVANVDEFETKIKAANAKDYFYRETFNTSLGLKIDFSTGIFLNGLHNGDFVLAEHKLRYTPRTLVVGSRGQDSVVIQIGAPSQTRDTTGNYIQRNSSKLNYSTGFLVHVYPRTGALINVGLATGVTIANNNGAPLQLLLGGSLMFNMGKSRLSLVGGRIWGQEKNLSVEARPFLKRNEDLQNQYASQLEIPRFYTGSPNIPTYDRRTHSWFFGLTYNFASLNIGK